MAKRLLSFALCLVFGLLVASSAHAGVFNAPHAKPMNTTTLIYSDKHSKSPSMESI